MLPLNQSIFAAGIRWEEWNRDRKRGGMKHFLTRSSGPNDPDWRGRLWRSLLTLLHSRLIVSGNAGVEGEMSKVRLRSERIFGSHPGFVKLRLQTVPAQIWLYLWISLVFFFFFFKETHMPDFLSEPSKRQRIVITFFRIYTSDDRDTV